MVDKIIQGKKRTHRQYASYYTDSEPILSYMVQKLNVAEGDAIFEPCAGDGAFIEKIFSKNSSDISIHAVDLNPIAVNNLKERFSSANILVEQVDTLLDRSVLTKKYSKIIGNPPYGAWQDLSKRDELKKIYGGYVKETYTLFLQKCIDLLEENGKLVFIIPDTFLALHMHKGTRAKILTKTRVEEILLIPSNFFPGVNFGYANLCIITLVKSESVAGNTIKIASVRDSVEKLTTLASGDYSECHSLESLLQDDVLNSENLSFFIGSNESSRSLMKEDVLKLGDIADCVTGFYSGDNKKYIRVLNKDIKRSNGYSIVDSKEVEYTHFPADILKQGLTKKSYIPYLKNAIGTFSIETQWFIQWDKNTVQEYKKDKRARFQNSEFYFKEGIGVPMIKSSNTHAVLLEKRLFDQSVVGVFPKDLKHRDYLLAFLNSKTCSKLLNIINHTANNSANYLKKLPIIVNDEGVKVVNKIMSKYFESKDKTKALAEIDEFFTKLYNLD